MVEERAKRNPYILGVPIEEPDKFFGREELFSSIKYLIEQNTQLILLSGQRRIGKSSVLKQIQKKIDEKNKDFIFVNFDCQDKTNCSIDQVMPDIAREIVETLEQKEKEILITSKEHLIDLIQQLETDITIFQNQFLSAVYHLLNNKKLILMLDEFDVLAQENTEYKDIIYFIQSLQKQYKKLCIIVVAGRHIDKLETLRAFLKGAPNQEIGFLDKDSVEKQITKPVERNLEYEAEAISAIFQLSAGHPYCTQVICYTLFNVARERNKWTIARADVESIINKVFEYDNAQGGLAGFWDVRSPQEKVIISAVAEAQKRAKHENIPEKPLNLLRSYGVITETLTDVPKQLANYGFLDNAASRIKTDVPKQSDDAAYRIKIELVYRWLVINHSLRNEINTLAEIKQKNVNSLLSVADDLRQSGDLQEALQIHEQALALNPNNFTTVMSLAEEYLRVENLDKAFELLMRAYKFYSFSETQEKMQEKVLHPLLSLAEKYVEKQNFDKAVEIYTLCHKIDPEISKDSLSSRYLAQAQEYLEQQNFDKALEIYTLCYEIYPEISKDGLLNARERYGHELIMQRKWAEAEEQFQQVLAIAPERVNSQQRVKEIQVLKTKTTLTTENISTSENTSLPEKNANPNWWMRIPKGSIVTVSIGAIATISILSFGGYHFFRTCPVGKQKNLGFFCIEDTSKISRGDRTLFPNITNIFRDQGIAAFKQGNYQKAAELFDKAVTANRSDPEVLIYYNNARARQQGSFLTLAAVVPVVDNKIGNAQEMLRGVAQAQNQFNQNLGLSGRLLEIVIANDSNDENQAKQVAQELIKDQSILAVIGHNSSGVTQAALPEYEQAQLAVISPTSTSRLLQNPVFFRTVVSDEAAGKKLAEHSYTNLKLKKVVIFANPNSSYSNSIREIFTNYFGRLGGEVVRPPMIDLTASKFDADKEVPRSLYRFQAEAAMLFPDVKYTEVAINIAKANEQLKNSPTNPQRRALKLLGGDSLYSNEILSRGGSAFEGMILSVPWFRETPKAQEFAKQAQQQWGGGISWRTATSYDATKALIKSLSSNASRTTVLENLPNVTLPSSETSGDGLQFTPERERQGEPILVQVKGGKFYQVKDGS